MSVSTIGDIARQADASIEQVRYAIKSRGIQPDGRAGHYRVFGEEKVGQIRGVLDQIAARREALAS